MFGNLQIVFGKRTRGFENPRIEFRARLEIADMYLKIPNAGFEESSSGFRNYFIGLENRAGRGFIGGGF